MFRTTMVRTSTCHQYISDCFVCILSSYLGRVVVVVVVVVVVFVVCLLLIVCCTVLFMFFRLVLLF